MTMTREDILSALENGPYAFPGGYPLYFINGDGDVLSFAAVEENRESVLEACNNLDRHAWDEWKIVALETNWENPDLYCDHTGKRIESAYAEPEESE